MARLPAGPSAKRGRLLTALDRVALYPGEFADAAPWLDKAVRVHTALGAQEPLARTLFMRGAALLHLGKFDAAVAVLERARTNAARRQRAAAARRHLNLVKVHTQRGQVDLSVACLDEGKALADALRQPGDAEAGVAAAQAGAKRVRLLGALQPAAEAPVPSRGVLATPA